MRKGFRLRLKSSFVSSVSPNFSFPSAKWESCAMYLTGLRLKCFLFNSKAFYKYKGFYRIWPLKLTLLCLRISCCFQSAVCIWCQTTSSMWLLFCQALWGYESSQVMFSWRINLLDGGHKPVKNKKWVKYCRCSDKTKHIWSTEGEQKKNVQVSLLSSHTFRAHPVFITILHSFWGWLFIHCWSYPSNLITQGSSMSFVFISVP